MIPYSTKYSFLAREPDFESQSDYEFEDDLMEPEPPQKRTVPTVFMWENGGREVLLSGSFNDWKTRIPMSQRFVHTCIFKISGHGCQVVIYSSLSQHKLSNHNQNIIHIIKLHHPVLQRTAGSRVCYMSTVIFF